MVPLSVRHGLSSARDYNTSNPLLTKMNECGFGFWGHIQIVLTSFLLNVIVKPIWGIFSKWDYLPMTRIPVFSQECRNICILYVSRSYWLIFAMWYINFCLSICGYPRHYEQTTHTDIIFISCYMYLASFTTL